MEESDKKEDKEYFLKTYRDFIKDKSKDDLVDIICGDKDNPPIFNRSEPSYSRVQITWALSKVMPDKTMSEIDSLVDLIVYNILQHRNEFIYNYDYFRFDIKKPGFKIFALMVFLSIFGLIKILIYVIGLIF